MIHNYDEISILDNSLVFLDLDETIIRFPFINSNWWDKTIKAYELIDINTADERAYKDWQHIITTYNPIILDEHQFSLLINRIVKTNSKIIILTARDEKLKDITKKHLNKCKIFINDIFFSKNKGNTIEIIKQNHKYKNIIFVDDNIKYINDVKKINPEVITYHIKHKKLI